MLPADKQTEINELVYKAFRLGIDAFIGKFGEDLSFEVIFQAIRFEIFQLIMLDFVNSTQPSLGAAAVQFGHNAIRADTQTTLATIETYDAQLSDFANLMDSLTKTALGNKSLVRGVTGVSAEIQKTLLAFQTPASSFSLKELEFNLDLTLGVLKAPVEAAVETSFAVATFAPIIGKTLSVDPAKSVITAAMTGAEALPPPPSAGAGPIATAGAAIREGPAATDLPALIPKAAPASTPQPCQRRRQYRCHRQCRAIWTSSAKSDKILAANDVAAYDAEAPNLLAANNALFNYLISVGQRAYAALPLLAGTAASDVQTLVPQYDAAADNVGLLYLALELWTVAQDANSQTLATSYAADAKSALTAVGQQAVLVQSDLKGVTIPGRIVIAGDGAPGWVTFQSPVAVDYSFTNVGDKPLSAGCRNTASECKSHTADTGNGKPAGAGSGGNISGRLAV